MQIKELQIIYPPIRIARQRYGVAKPEYERNLLLLAGVLSVHTDSENYQSLDGSSHGQVQYKSRHTLGHLPDNLYHNPDEVFHCSRLYAFFT